MYLLYLLAILKLLVLAVRHLARGAGKSEVNIGETLDALVS